MPKRTASPKRDPRIIAKLTDKFVGFVKQHPGLRIEQINPKLGTATKDLALPVRKAIAAGRIKTKGQKRATTYQPGRRA
jgi:hypothetical protein